VARGRDEGSIFAHLFWAFKMIANTRNKIWKKTIAAVVVCLFLANQLVFAYPTDTLATQGLSNPETREEILRALWDDRYDAHEGKRLTATGDEAEALPERIADLPVIAATCPKEKRKLRAASIQLLKGEFTHNTDRMVDIISKMTKLGEDAPHIVVFPELMDSTPVPSDDEISARHQRIKDIVLDTGIAVVYVVYKGAEIRAHVCKRNEDDTVQELEFDKGKQAEEPRKFTLWKGCDVSLFVCDELTTTAHLSEEVYSQPSYADDIRESSLIIHPRNIWLTGYRHLAQATFNHFGVPIIAANASLKGAQPGQSFFIANNGQIIKVPKEHEEAITIADVTTDEIKPGPIARPAIDVFLEEHLDTSPTGFFGGSRILPLPSGGGLLYGQIRQEIYSALENSFASITRPDNQTVFDYLKTLPVERDGTMQIGMDFQIALADSYHDEEGKYCEDRDPLPFDVDEPQKVARAHVSGGRLTIFFTEDEIRNNEVKVTVGTEELTVTCACFAVAMATHELDSRSDEGEKAVDGLTRDEALEALRRPSEHRRIEMQNAILRSGEARIPQAYHEHLASLHLKPAFPRKGRDYAAAPEDQPTEPEMRYIIAMCILMRGGEESEPAKELAASVLVNEEALDGFVAGLGLDFSEENYVGEWIAEFLQHRRTNVRRFKRCRKNFAEEFLGEYVEKNPKLELNLERIVATFFKGPGAPMNTVKVKEGSGVLARLAHASSERRRDIARAIYAKLREIEVGPSGRILCLMGETGQVQPSSADDLQDLSEAQRTHAVRLSWEEYAQTKVSCLDPRRPIHPNLVEAMELHDGQKRTERAMRLTDREIRYLLAAGILAQRELAEGDKIEDEESFAELLDTNIPLKYALERLGYTFTEPLIAACAVLYLQSLELARGQEGITNINNILREVVRNHELGREYHTVLAIFEPGESRRSVHVQASEMESRRDERIAALRTIEKRDVAGLRSTGATIVGLLTPGADQDQPRGPKGDAGISGAMHEGQRAEKRVRALDRLLRMKGINLRQLVEQQRKDDDKAKIREALVGIGLNDEQIGRVLDKIALIDISADDAERLGLERQDARIGAVIIPAHGGFMTVLQRDRLQNPDPQALGDLFHDIIEIQLLEQRIRGNEAHSYAMRARDRFLAEGPQAAAGIFNDLTDPYRIAKFELSFSDALREVFTEMGIPTDSNLTNLADVQLSDICRAFLGKLEAGGWQAPPTYRARFERMLILVLTNEKIGDFAEYQNDNFDMEDMIICMRRIHYFAINPLTIIREEMYPEVSLIDVATVPSTYALRYKLLCDAKLIGDAWDEMEPPGAEVLEWLSGDQPRFDRVFDKLVGHECEEVLPILKAVAEHFHIDIWEGEHNFIQTEVQNYEKDMARSQLFERADNAVQAGLVDRLQVDFYKGICAILVVCSELQNQHGISVDRVIAKGHDGILMFGVHEGERVAIKIDIPRAGSTVRQVAASLKSVIGQTYQNPHFVNKGLIENIPVTGNFSVVVEINELVDGIDMQTLYGAADAFNLDLGRNSGIALQALEIQAELHSRGIGVFDIENLKNIMVDDSGVMKFVDLGSIRTFDNRAEMALDELEQARGSPLTTSQRAMVKPEVVANIRRDRKRVAILSTIRFLTGQVYWMEDTDVELEQIISNEKFREMFTERYGQGRRDLADRIYAIFARVFTDDGVSLATIIRQLREALEGHGVKIASVSGIVGAMHEDDMDYAAKKPEPPAEAGASSADAGGYLAAAAALFDITKPSYWPINFLSKDAGVAESVAKHALDMLCEIGVMERQDRRGQPHYRRTENRERRPEYIRVLLSDLFSRDHPLCEDNITRYGDATARVELAGAIRENIVNTRQIRKGQEDEPEEGTARFFYKHDALTTGSIIEQIRNLQQRHKRKGPRKFIININTHPQKRMKLTGPQKKAMEEQAQLIATAMKVDVEFRYTLGEKDPSLTFECLDADGGTIGKTSIEQYSGKLSLSRTIAVLNLGFAASVVPHVVSAADIENYRPLLELINRQYSRINMLGRELFDLDKTPASVIEEILHKHPINVILPPVKKIDFRRHDEIDFQYRALEKYA